MFDFSGVDPPKNEKDLYGLRYAEFVVPLVKAVQEQQDIIEVQENKLTIYEQRLESQQRELEELQKTVRELKELIER